MSKFVGTVTDPSYEAAIEDMVEKLRTKRKAEGEHTDAKLTLVMLMRQEKRYYTS